MVRQDIVAGIRNALERGESLEQAKATLINSGYNQGDVLEAANYLTGGLGNQPIENHAQVQGTIKTQAAPETKQLMPMAPKATKKKFPMGMIILLALIVIVLISILVSSFIFKDSLISFFQDLFG